MNDTLSRKEKGLPYRYDDPILLSDQHERQDLLHEFNQLKPSRTAEKAAMSRKIFGSIGEGCHIETPVHSNWGCSHVFLGNGIYCNSSVTFVDDAPIFIGDHTMIGPNTVFSTSGHPILPILREHNYVYNKPIHVGKNVWIGSGVQVLPGVSIGDNCVIGAGSVVTHDIPADSVAYGNPCQVIRPIGERDQKYFYKQEELDVWE